MMTILTPPARGANLAKWLILPAPNFCNIRSSLHRLVSILLAFLLAAGLLRAAEPLDSIPSIRALTPAEAAKNRPVSIEAVVIFYNPPRLGLVVHDGQDGIFVSLARDLVPGPEFAVGTRVRIEGRTQPGGFLPIVEARRISVLGPAALPEPRRISPGELYSPALDCQWVEVPAIVTGVENAEQRILVAEVSGWTVKLLLPIHAGAGESWGQFMQRPVLLRAIVGSVFNTDRQLTGRHFFVPSLACLIPTDADLPGGDPRLSTVNELLRSDATSTSRVRVRGTVTWAAADALYLRGEGGSLQVRAAGTNGLVVGARVEAEGFAAVAPFRPVLRATRVSPLEPGPPPPPEPLALGAGRIAQQQAELVFVEAEFLSQREGQGAEAILNCRAGDWLFEARLPDRATLRRDLEPGDHLRLTGICELTTTRPLPFSESADGFRLLLRTTDDVVIVQSAPWWTLRRLLWALGTLGLLAFASIVWAALLRRRVAEQTKIIGVQIERAVVKDERQRIARELHDTIEQELAGLSVQLRNARQRLAQTPEQAATAIDLAERMLRHCRAEARTSIRDLRSVALEQRGLPGALEELIAPLAADGGATFAIEVTGPARPLAGPLDMHLLRIAHQAVANAVQHGAAKEIQVSLTYAAEAVTLMVRDNGSGFDSAAPAPRGHFGLLGIRERVNKLQANLAIESAPGTGTTIRVVAPIPAAPASGNGSAL